VSVCACGGAPPWASYSAEGVEGVLAGEGSLWVGVFGPLRWVPRQAGGVVTRTPGGFAVDSGPIPGYGEVCQVNGTPYVYHLRERVHNFHVSKVDHVHADSLIFEVVKHGGLCGRESTGIGRC
jgi:hypothetical protein